MTVRIHLHPDMRYLAENSETVETAGATVGECIDQLVARYPALRELIFAPDGELRTYIEIYVNRRTAFPDELQQPVEDGSHIHLMLTIAGG